jgi:hypothetical protein
MTANYHKHLDDRKRRTLIMNGAIADSALSQTLLNIVFMNTPEGIAALGDAIAAGWPALIDLGATYGTAFLDMARPDVGAARRESGTLVTVSVIARLSDALKWMDMDKIHPLVVDQIKQGALSLFQRVIFVRFPANELGQSLGQYCVNEDGKIQVMFFPEDDPLLTYLREKHQINAYEVRSSNITGSPEEPFAPGAVDYACAIAAPIVAISSLEALNAQMIDQALYKQGIISLMRRKRFGSFPIIRLPQRTEDSQAAPVVSIVRAGNTTPDTVTRLVKGCLSGVDVVYTEEKHGHVRHEYESPFDDAQSIQSDLIRASREVDTQNYDKYLG